MRPLFLCQLFYGLAKRAAYRRQHRCRHKAGGEIHREHPGQRQAVPLLRPEAPIVGTGMEHKICIDSEIVVCLLYTSPSPRDRG